MKVLIQNAEDRKFLASDDQWTESPHEAEDFLLGYRAHQLARSKPCRIFNVLFYFPELDSFLRVMHGRGTLDASGAH